MLLNSGEIFGKGKKVHLCFIDYTKAFDRIDHVKLMEIMKETGTPSHELRLLTELYKNQRAFVRVGTNITEVIAIQKAVRQGCILSPCLFNLYSEKVIQETLNEQDGISINDERILNIRYANDTALLAENKEQLQRMVNSINNICKKYDMNLNAKKMKVVVTSKRDTGEQLEININDIKL